MSSSSLHWTDENLLDLEDTSVLHLDPVPTRHATVRDSRVTKKEKLKWKRNISVEPSLLKGNFLNNTGQQLNYQSAVAEARRCLKCADAPCQKSCPTSLDVRTFIGSIGTGNVYGSAKQILSDNPIGLSCGMVCPTSELCVGSCNLAHLEGESGMEMGGAGGGKGAINIHGLQAYAVDSFRKMNIPQIRDPSLPTELPASYSTKIALVGAGPSSISCATFLARLGYSDITIFEKSSAPGGLSTQEIPQTRLPFEAVEFETKLMLDLGVKIQYNTEFGKDITIPSLRQEGFKAIYLGFGLPDAKSFELFNGLSDKEGYYTSKSFLPLVTKASKKIQGGCACDNNNSKQLPRLYGKVVVLGAGDTAFDVASSAIRCGAEKVIVAFRKGFSGIRAVPEEYEIVLHEKADVLPYASPKEVIIRDGRISGLELYHGDYVNGKEVFDEDEFIRVKCDFVISAFGSTLSSQSVIDGLLPVKINEYGIVPVDTEMRTNEVDVFAGGDLSGNGLTVEAANDGKTGSWYMHKYIQEIHGLTVPQEPTLPKFYTPIDLVDLSVNVAGMKFKNPFGLASAPPATTCEMIARAFEMGWGFAVTKTFSMDKDIVTNVAPRIIGGSTTGTKENAPNHSSYLNIELISEKSASYWCNGIRQLKQRFPDNIVIASIMSAFVKEDWQTLAIRSEECGADAIELNLSCPHGMGERGMGLACGQDPELVREICKWVKEVTKIPVFAKLTPNVTDITTIAAAAREGGADGCTATNTVSGLMNLNRKGDAWPSIGEKKQTTYGGMSGNAIRPIALRAVSAIHKKFPDFPILATGGIDSAEAALQFIHAGASVCQISSAVQNQNFSIIDDLSTGLKTLLFMNGHQEFDGWDSQAPPKTHRKRLVGKGLPKFGNYLEKRRELQAEDIENNGPLVYEDNLEIPQVNIDLKKVPTLNESIGKAVSRITAWGNLDPEAKEHVVAVVDEETCINCGLCYNICADTGYQAITFDKDTHIPVITDNCTGCTLCFSCPVDAISMVPRSQVGRAPYKPSRGIPLGEFSEAIRIEV